MLRIDHAAGQSRGRKTKDPCPGCALRKELCICASMPKLDLKTRLTLIVHAKELKRTTNTGRLAARALVNSEVVVRGLGHVDLAQKILPGYRPLFFFPAPGARELTPALLTESPLPVQLLVPDGNWRQAAKVKARHPEISDIPCVMIAESNPADAHLRAEHLDYGMSTLEAIAKAMRLLEDEAVFEALNRFYLAKLDATLKGRGRLPFAGLRLE
jgi:DTW domain-containing protein YfiP